MPISSLEQGTSVFQGALARDACQNLSEMLARNTNVLVSAPHTELPCPQLSRPCWPCYPAQDPVRNNPQAEEPRSSQGSTTLTRPLFTPKSLLPLPVASQIGGQSPAPAAAAPLTGWSPPAQAKEQQGRRQQEPGQTLCSLLSPAVLRAITLEHRAIPKSINNFYAAQGTLLHLIKVSSHSYGFISP